MPVVCFEISVRNGLGVSVWHGIGFSLAVASLVWTSGAVLLFAHLARGMGRVGVSGFLEGRSGGALAAFIAGSAAFTLEKAYPASSEIDQAVDRFGCMPVSLATVPADLYLPLIVQ